MHEPLLEKFEEGGGERIQKPEGHNLDGVWGAIFPGMDAGSDGLTLAERTAIEKEM